MDDAIRAADRTVSIVTSLGFLTIEVKLASDRAVNGENVRLRAQITGASAVRFFGRTKEFNSDRRILLSQMGMIFGHYSDHKHLLYVYYKIRYLRMKVRTNTKVIRYF